MKKLIITVIIFLSSLQVVYSQWEQSDGIYGGRVYSLAINNDIIFAGTERNGVYLSTNNGANWTQTGLLNREINSLIVNENMIFAGTDTGVYLSTDTGNSWTIKGLNDEMIYSLTFSSSNLFAGTNYGVFLSTNNGLSWAQTSLNNWTTYSLYASDNRIFAGTHHGVFLSTNSGTDWTNVGLSNYWIYSLAINNNNVFAGVGGTANGVFLSTNNGLSWTQTSLNNRFIKSLSISGNKIFAGTYNNGVYLSTNNGQNWVQTSPNNTTVNSIVINGNNIFAGTESRGIFRSSNNGANWIQTAFNNEWIYSLIVNVNTIFVGTSRQGLVMSTNNGANWIPNSLNTYGIYSLALSGNKMIAGTGGAVFLSTNYGINWMPTGSIPQTVRAVAIIGNNLIAGCNGTGFFYSTNNGVNWFNSGIVTSVYSFAVRGNNIFAGTHGRGVYKTTNYGINWMQSGLYNYSVSSLTINGNNIYAGLRNSGVYKSTNDGSNWNYLGLYSKIVNAIMINGNTIIAGTQDSGVFISTNDGMNWIRKNEGFPENLTVKSFCINDNYIFVGSYGYSIWKRRLSELISGNHDFSAGPFIDFPEVLIKDSSYHIKAKITNEGREPETNVPIRFLINGTQVGYYLRSLPAGGIDTVDFTWTPNTAGDFNVAVVSALPTDINRSNDTVKADVRVYSSPALPIFCDDFSGGTANWTITNDGGTCVWQAYSPPYPNAYSLPETSSGNVLSADADNCGSGTTLLSTATIIENVDCSMFEHVYLEFDNDWNAIDEQDTAIVEVSYDGGASWSSVIAWGGTDVRNTQESYILPGADANPSVRIRFRSIQPGWDWWWAVDNVCLKGFPVTGLTQNSKIPTEYALMQNCPNPFNPTTKIKFDLPKSTQARLIIYDILGREVTKLVNEKLSAGSYEVNWFADFYPSGVYFYRIITKDFSQTKRMVLIK